MTNLTRRRVESWKHLPTRVTLRCRTPDPAQTLAQTKAPTRPRQQPAPPRIIASWPRKTHTQEGVRTLAYAQRCYRTRHTHVCGDDGHCSKLCVCRATSLGKSRELSCATERRWHQLHTAQAHSNMVYLRPRCTQRYLSYASLDSRAMAFMSSMKDGNSTEASMSWWETRTFHT